MYRLPRLCTALLAFAVAASAARAEHAKIQLDVKVDGQTTATAFVDQTPPAWGKNPRPVIRAKVGQEIQIQWVLTNVYPHKTLENVVVHSFVAPQEKTGQKELPDLSRESIPLETAYELDLKPGAKTGARAALRLDRPGAYLIRVESRNTQSDHEHFAAVDLVIEK
jgi:hypothetical protein